MPGNRTRFAIVFGQEFQIKDVDNPVIIQIGCSWSLEAVDVRAGGFFAGGMFSYRVNPSGSIFVGASGKGAAAADAELLVVTFRPIRPGATAELTLSSVLLQSAAGRSIALDRPTAFRTSIVQ